MSPGLESAVKNLGPQEEISVIITFQEKVNLKAFQDPDKKQRRPRIIRALQGRAEASQGVVRTFLERSGRASPIKQLWIVNGLAATLPADLVGALAQMTGIETIAEDTIIHVPDMATAASTLSEWNIIAIGAPELWALGYTGQGVVVASMDTGVDVTHPDLEAKWRGGTNSWYDPYGIYFSPVDHDHDGHGTAVMGVMVGGDAGGTNIGVAPGAQWIAVKIFDDAGIAYTSKILDGFQWLLDPDDNPDTDDAPDVVNNSWGYDGASGLCLETPNPNLPPLGPAIAALKAAGIAVVFSGGNSGPGANSSVSPANYPESFSVGAVNEFLDIAGFSSRGPSACDGRVFPDVVAPGVNIRTADPAFNGSYSYWSGTSFAAPHVAGTMALVMGAFQGLLLADLEFATKYYAHDLGLPGPDNDYGYGLIDAVEVFKAFQDPIPSIFPWPPSHNFGSVRTGESLSQAFRIVNRGFGIENLTILDLFVDGLHSADFDIQNDNCAGTSLAPKEECGFDVLFSPRAKGAENAVLHIPSNDPRNPVLDIVLMGTGCQVSIGVFRNGRWYLDANANGIWDGPDLDRRLAFGLSTDVPVTGDWNGDGVTDIGVFGGGKWYLDANGNGIFDGPELDRHLFFGLSTDVPVTGDWNGDGVTNIGLFRGGKWYLDANGNGWWDGTLGDRVLAFGLGSDVPVTGDWNGDGVTDIGVFRAGKWYLDANGNGVWDGPLGDRVLAFGLGSDVPVTGDWNGDGVTDIGVFRAGKWFLDANGDHVWSVSQDEVVTFGVSTDLPLGGNW